MLSGTEANIINTVAKLREATKDQIRKEVGFSLDYIGYLCGYLVRKGYLNFSNGHYSLGKMGIKSLLTEETPKIDPRTKDFGVGVDRKLIKEIANEVAGEISEELNEIKIIATQIRQKAGQVSEEKIKIKTDFDFPVEDESLALESNINKIGPSLEKEKSYIGESIKLFKKLFKKIQKGGRDA